MSIRSKVCDWPVFPQNDWPVFPQNGHFTPAQGRNIHCHSLSFYGLRAVAMRDFEGLVIIIIMMMIIII